MALSSRDSIFCRRFRCKGIYHFRSVRSTSRSSLRAFCRMFSVRQFSPRRTAGRSWREEPHLPVEVSRLRISFGFHISHSDRSDRRVGTGATVAHLTIFFEGSRRLQLKVIMQFQKMKRGKLGEATAAFLTLVARRSVWMKARSAHCACSLPPWTQFQVHLLRRGG